MHFIRRFGAASACALAFAWPATFAQAPASSVEATIDATRDEAAIIDSPRWRDLVTRLRDDALRGPADEAAMRAACGHALARARPTGVSASDACLRAALASFDPNATYFSPRETAAHHEESTRNWVGIGLELGRNAPHDPILVASPIAGASGERAGLRPGDLIVRIDGHDMAPLTMEQAVAFMRGPVDSVVRLDIERGPSHDKLTISATREPIHVMSVRHEPSTARVAALRVIQFNQYTMEDLDKRVGEILRADRPAPEALLLDLRANPGGLLDTVVQFAGACSTDDTIAAHLVTRAGDKPLAAATTKLPLFALSAATKQWLAQVRVAVVVDERTASGAEALALFLRERRGARLVGARTFGLAGVDTILFVGSDASIRVRTSDLHSSRNISWEGSGVVPDTIVPPVPAGTRQPEFGSAEDEAFALALRSLATR